MKKIERALISLTDKSGIEEFSKQLQELGIEILSTGGTAKKIREAGVAVKDVAEFTQFPEMLDGRVKTLHPKVHGGILNQRDNDNHRQQCREHGISNIDLAAVNLYAFEKTVADVTVIVDPTDYELVLAEIRSTGNTTLKTRFYLATKVFALTSQYDTAISEWLESVNVDKNEYFKGE